MLTVSENGIVIWVQLALDQEKPSSLSLSVLTIVLSICDIQFEKFNSNEKFINP